MVNNFDAIIIGSGMGGMSCAASLALLGKKVLVLEQHYVAGGMTHTFKRKDFEWDVGVHALGEMGPNRLPGKLVQWLSQDKLKMNSYGHPYETFFFPENDKFEYPNDKDGFKKNLIERFPNEQKNIEKYFDIINEVGKLAKVHFSSRLMPSCIEGLLSPFIKRKFHYWSDKTVKEVLDELFDDSKLKSILAGQWGYYGAAPSQASFFIHAITTRHFWEGAYYPEGSSKTIADTFLCSVTDNGGKVLLKTRAESLILKNDCVIGVNTNQGEFFAPLVISAIGAKATVNRLLPKKHQSEKWARDINELEQSPSHVCLYLGFEGDIKASGATESNQWWCETWDFENTFWDLDNDEAPILYTSFPSLKDPHHQTMSKDGRPLHTGEVVTFVKYEDFKNWEGTKVGRRGTDYKDFKKSIEKRMMDQIKKHLPDLMEKCVYHELSTPLSTTHYCEAPQGAIYGLLPTPKRWRTRALRPKTPLKGFYMTGADIGTLGVVGALIGGVLTAASIDKRVAKKLMGK
ncbi:MAG: NAD(P)/FAD-dependent oxidoreductase [Bdellovibrionales bacterium]|jgi:all-trans-retinol 13,14-reductase|nr:NAD(P)/FAD-dependent oxidoreductase [Bdellovibrionales bacterium]